MTVAEPGDSRAVEPAERGCPRLDFDHHTVGEAERFEVWGGLRKLAPVFWSEHYGGFWVATSYEAVSAILGDPTTFSSAKTADGKGGQAIPPFVWRRNVPGEYDGEEHKRLRQVFLPAVSPRAIDARRTTIERMVREIFDALEGKAEIDVVREIAVPVPARSMFDFMGLPQDEAVPTGLTVAEIMATPRGVPHPKALDELLEKINQRMLDEVEARRRAPRDDLITQFAHLENERRLLDADELIGVLVTSLLFGGLATAARVLASAIVYLGADRGVRRQLIEQPNLIPNFVQDAVRWTSPAAWVGRTVTAETVLGGQTLRPGQRILAMIGSANMDEQAFDNPQRINPSGWRNGHLGFGLGAHFCPGAPLARVEIELALRELLIRMPDFELVDGGNAARPGDSLRSPILRPRPAGY
jgi:cytochrome P450